MVGPNATDSTGQDNSQPGDPTLTNLAGITTYDAAALDFDFVPPSSGIPFRFVFASEEYNEFVYKGYNDVFAIFINGTNCALVPGTNLAVSVDRINGGNPFGAANASRPELFKNNARDSGAPMNTEMDGLTTVLTCSAPVTPGATNHARLAIADAGDAILDTAVFIEGRSGTSPVRHGGDGTKSASKNQCHKTKGPVNCATGNFWHTFTDLTVPGRGPALDFNRTYNSQDAGTDGPFGPGWTSSYTMSLTGEPPSNPPTAPVTSAFSPLTPARILDTRPGQLDSDGHNTALGPGQTIEVTVTGVGGVPASGVGAVVLDLTATEPSAAGYLGVFPANEAMPAASSLNFAAGQTIANMVTAKVSADGKVKIYNGAGTTHVVADVAGWFSTGSDYKPLTPARILDTRPGQLDSDGHNAALGPGQTIDVTVTGVGGVPASGVGAVALNVTAAGPTAAGYLTNFPTGVTRPVSASLLFSAGQNIANEVTAKVGANGKEFEPPSRGHRAVIERGVSSNGNGRRPAPTTTVGRLDVDERVSGANGRGVIAAGDDD